MGPNFKFMYKHIGLHRHTNKHIQYQYFLWKTLGTTSQKFISKVNTCVWMNYWSPNRDFFNKKRQAINPLLRLYHYL
jgi:hypothetical protein